MSEAFQPIAVRPRSENKIFFWFRCLFDFQLLTISSFLTLPISHCKGKLLDVGAGEVPWREFFPPSIEYVGVDVDTFSQFGMRSHPNVIYYDGKILPFEDSSFDHVLCVEVLEHVPDPMNFLVDIRRVMRQEATLIMTVPWSARIHHLPNDFNRFSRFGLAALLKSSGFSIVCIEERGNDVAAIANKLLVLMVRLIRPSKPYNITWTWALAVLLMPLAAIFVGVAHISLFLGLGSKEDPLGYGVIAKKS